MRGGADNPCEPGSRIDNAQQLNFSIVSSTFPDLVALSINNGRYLSADALEGDQNDNWTGTLEVVIRAEDRWGSGQSSNPFKITVQNVNDPPVITSEPPLGAYGDVEWVYRVLAEDGDRDRLSFTLAAGPAGMAINGSTGVITWIPQRWGRFPVSVHVSDGPTGAWQNFTLAVPNRPPAITSQPRTGALIGQAYSYAVRATDPDNDALAYSLGTGLEGFHIDPATGLVIGTPMLLGDHEFVIGASDGKAEVFQNFTLTVAWPNRSPYITSNTITAAQEGLPYSYDVRAYDNDKDPLEFSMEAGPSWLSIDSATGALSGIPELPGNYTVLIKVRDGRGGEGRHDFTLRVADSVAPSVTLDAPAGKVRGALMLAGTVGRGTRDVLWVEVRLDGGEWRGASLNNTWNLTVDTTRLQDGEHTVEVRAYDGWETSRTVKGVLEVDNSPVIQTKVMGPGSIAMLVVAIAIVLGAAMAGAMVIVRRHKAQGAARKA